MSHLIPSSRLSLGFTSVMLSFAVWLQGGTFTANFDDGQVPEGALVFGTVVIEPPGAGEDASLILTRSVRQ